MLSIFCVSAKVCKSPEEFSHKGVKIETNFTDDHLHFVGSQIVYVCTNPGESFPSGNTMKRCSCVDLGDDYRWEYEISTDPAEYECRG